MCSIAPENVILFIGVTRRLHLFVDEHPTSILTSSIGRVVCESSPIIQLFLYLLDKNLSITFSGAMCSIAPQNVTSITFSGSITFSVVTPAHKFKNSRIIWKYKFAKLRSHIYSI